MKRLDTFLAWLLFLGIVVSWGLWHRPPDPVETPPPDVIPEVTPEESPEKLREEALQRARIQLDWAQKEAEWLVEEHLRDLDEFFVMAKKNAPAFADEVLGWGSKWRLITDHVPIIGTDGAHERFLAERFTHHLFSRETLEKHISKVLIDLAEDLQDMEAQMLVKIRQDLEKIPGEPNLAKLNFTRLEGISLPPNR